MLTMLRGLLPDNAADYIYDSRHYEGSSGKRPSNPGIQISSCVDQVLCLIIEPDLDDASLCVKLGRRSRTIQRRCLVQ